MKVNDLRLPCQHVVQQALFEIARKEPLPERASCRLTRHSTRCATPIRHRSPRTCTALSSLENTRDRLTEFGLRPRQAIDHMLDAIRGLEAERLVRDVRDAERLHRSTGADRPNGHVAEQHCEATRRLGTVAATTAASRPATAQLASSSQRSSRSDRLPTHSSTRMRDERNRRQRREPVRRHAGPFDRAAAASAAETPADSRSCWPTANVPR